MSDISISHPHNFRDRIRGLSDLISMYAFRGRHGFIATVIVASVIVGGAALGPGLPIIGGGGGSPAGGVDTANLWIDNNGGSCTRSATLISYADATACGTFSGAFTAASGGDTVGVVAGSYAGEDITGNKGSFVTFENRTGDSPGFSTRVTLTNLHYAKFDGLNFRTSDTYNDLTIDACNDNVVITRAPDSRRFFIMEGNSNITISDSFWGGYSTAGITNDNAIGTSGGSGPTRLCGGSPAPPTSSVTISGNTFHDVFWNVPTWGGAHPDCFEINGNVNGVTVTGNTFNNCGDSFMGVYPDQGDVLNVTISGNTYTNLNNTGVTYYGIQILGSGANGNMCGNVVFSGNQYTPNNSSAGYPYSSLRAGCVTRATYSPVSISANTFQKGPPPSECTTSRAAPYNTNWTGNTFTIGDPCP